MKILFTLIFTIVLFVVYVWYLEESSIFIPDREVRATPEQIDLSFDDVYFKSGNSFKLNGWFVKASDDPKRHATVIFSHGNAGNISDRLEKIFLFNRLGLNVFIYDYRGYGNSEGKSTEKGMYEDVTAAYDYLTSRNDVDLQKIISYGASLGGAAAVDLATKRDVSCLIIDSSFTNAADMAKRIFPFIPSFLIRTKLDSVGKIKGIKAPKLFIHSQDDRTVPIALGRKLYAAARSPKEFTVIQGDHNGGHIESQDLYWGSIENFLKKHNLL